MEWRILNVAWSARKLIFLTKERALVNLSGIGQAKLLTPASLSTLYLTILVNNSTTLSFPSLQKTLGCGKDLLHKRIGVLEILARKGVWFNTQVNIAGQAHELHILIKAVDLV